VLRQKRAFNSPLVPRHPIGVCHDEGKQRASSLGKKKSPSLCFEEIIGKGWEKEGQAHITLFPAKLVRAQKNVARNPGGAAVAPGKRKKGTGGGANQARRHMSERSIKASRLGQKGRMKSWQGKTAEKARSGRKNAGRACEKQKHTTGDNSERTSHREPAQRQGERGGK